MGFVAFPAIYGAGLGLGKNLAADEGRIDAEER
jgi:hypothetical protein